MNEDLPSMQEVARALSLHQFTPEQWKLWKSQMRRHPQWFVLGRASRKGDRWRALAGPFSSPQEAQSIADTRADDGVREGRQDLRLVYKTQVKSLTETIRIYHNNITLLVEDLSEAETPAPNQTIPLPPATDPATRAGLAS